MKKPKVKKPVRRKRLRDLSINHLIPNMLTIMALAAGLTAIRYGLDGQWERAMLAVVAAAILDGLDGRIARLLKGVSKFGAELDSLSDFVCFGVAPAMVLYLWTMKDAGRLGWVLVMLFTICCGLRLARFNVMMENPETAPWKARFFTGVPAPAGAMLVLLPLMFSFQVGDEFFRRPWVVAVFLLAIGALLVSTLPTFSFKRIRVEGRLLLPTMLIIAATAVFLINAPWMTLSVVGIAYIATFPFSYRAHRRQETADGGGPDADGSKPPDPV